MQFCNTKPVCETGGHFEAACNIASRWAALVIPISTRSTSSSTFGPWQNHCSAHLQREYRGSLCVCVYIYVVERSNSCENVVLRGSISYFLATRSSQTSAEAANDVDPKYYLNPRSIVSVQVRLGLCRHCVGVHSNICVTARKNLCSRMVLQGCGKLRDSTSCTCVDCIILHDIHLNTHCEQQSSFQSIQVTEK